MFHREEVFEEFEPCPSKRIRGPRFKKSLGQHFLRDPNTALQIALAVPTDVLAVEIGPGDGFLSKELLETGHRLLGVEIDPEWRERLQNRLQNNLNFKLITGNILTLDWDSLATKEESLCVVGNLPYHLTSPVLFSVFRRVRERKPPTIQQMVVMVQAEVGRRLTASPGNKTYGALTLLAKYHAEVELLFTVPASAFVPRPAVDGAVLRFVFHAQQAVPTMNYDLFRRVVRGCFAQRRKMLRNAICVVNGLPPGWESLPFDFTKRPEQFTFDEYVKLTAGLAELLRDKV